MWVPNKKSNLKRFFFHLLSFWQLLNSLLAFPPFRYHVSQLAGILFNPLYIFWPDFFESKLSLEQIWSKSLVLVYSVTLMTQLPSRQRSRPATTVGEIFAMVKLLRQCTNTIFSTYYLFCKKTSYFVFEDKKLWSWFFFFNVSSASLVSFSHQR